MRLLIMWAAVMALALAAGAGLMLMQTILAHGSEWAALALVGYSVAAVAGAWWLLCWLGFRLGIR